MKARSTLQSRAGVGTHPTLRIYGQRQKSALSRRPSNPPKAAPPDPSATADAADLTVSEILAAAHRAAQELSDNARPGAAAAAVLPLLQPSQHLSCMRAHARAAAAALVLTLDEQLIEELCRCAARARCARHAMRSRCVSLVAQSEEPLFFEFIVEAGNPFTLYFLLSCGVRSTPYPCSSWACRLRM